MVFESVAQLSTGAAAPDHMTGSARYPSPSAGCIFDHRFARSRARHTCGLILLASTLLLAVVERASDAFVGESVRASGRRASARVDPTVRPAKVSSRSHVQPRVTRAAYDEYGEEYDDEEQGGDEIVSPFADGGGLDDEITTYPLTEENVEIVLDELRPFLQRDGGDVEVVELDGPMLKLRLLGSCSGCSSSATTMKNGIEARLYQKLPDLYHIESVMPDQEPLTKENIEAVLDGIRPFLSVSGGSIDLAEFMDNDTPYITLEMSGAAFKNPSVTMEVKKRIRTKFPLVHSVEIVEA